MSISPFSLARDEPLTISGEVNNIQYALSLVSYDIIGAKLITSNNVVNWRYVTDYLISNPGNNLKVKQGILARLIAENPVKVNTLGVGTNIHHGIYGILSSTVEVSFELPEDLEGVAITLETELFLIQDQIKANTTSTVDWSGKSPPNQMDHEAYPEIISGYHYFSINPPPNTVRRTLAYANYIADGNTAMDAEPGEGHHSEFGDREWKSNWFINGELRRSWYWPRRLQSVLSKNDEAYCPNDEIGATSSHSISTWKGIDTFKKINNSVAWIPCELFAWPCASLYRFYSVASHVDNLGSCRNRSISVGFLFPFMITSPIGAMGFSDFGTIDSLRSYMREKQYFSVYGRPYQDDSDGSGVWHQIA